MGRFRAPNALIGISIVAVLTAACTALFTKPLPDRLRAKVVDNARRESEIASPRVALYWHDTLASADQATPPKDWCGAFVLWALHSVGLALGTKWDVGLGFLYRLPKTNSPKPGDIAYLEHMQHHALVTAVNGDQISLLNGNGYGGRITPSTMQRSAITAFYSIDPYIQQLS